MKRPLLRRQPKPAPCCSHCPGEQAQAPQAVTVKFDGGNEQEFIAWMRKHIRRSGGDPGGVLR